MRIDSADFVRATHQVNDFLRDGLAQVAFVGRSNVGKSSLLNLLLGRKGLARISSTPGRTRSVNYFLVNRRCYFVDLPGYGYAKAGKKDRQAWARLVEGYFRVNAEYPPVGFGVIQLVDSKVGATVLDIEAKEYLESFGSEPTVVATKIDRVPKSRRHASLAAIDQALALGGATPLAVSARTGEGARELWRVIDRHLEGVGRTE